MARGEFLVCGLGRFGGALARELVSLGHEVLGVDADARNVQDHASVLTHVVQADTTDPEAMRELGAPEFRTAIVAIGATTTAGSPALFSGATAMLALGGTGLGSSHESSSAESNDAGATGRAEALGAASGAGDGAGSGWEERTGAGSGWSEKTGAGSSETTGAGAGAAAGSALSAG